ncbi:hypothetical protein EBR21_05275 [bacterium]|nr:hypothetical protein [bacterium]
MDLCQSNADENDRFFLYTAKIHSVRVKEWKIAFQEIDEKLTCLSGLTVRRVDTLQWSCFTPSVNPKNCLFYQQ